MLSMLGGSVPLALDELAGCLPSRDSVEEQVDARELGRAISAFVRQLKQRDGDLFLRRYFYMDSLEDAAAFVGMSPKNAAVLRIHSICTPYKGNLHTPWEKMHTATIFR